MSHDHDAKRRGRPSLDGLTRSEQVSLSLPAKQLHDLRREAEQERMRLQDYLRRRLRAGSDSPRG